MPLCTRADFAGRKWLAVNNRLVRLEAEHGWQSQGLQSFYLSGSRKQVESQWFIAIATLHRAIDRAAMCPAELDGMKVIAWARHAVRNCPIRSDKLPEVRAQRRPARPSIACRPQGRSMQID